MFVFFIKIFVGGRLCIKKFVIVLVNINRNVLINICGEFVLELLGINKMVVNIEVVIDVILFESLFILFNILNELIRVMI